MWMHHPGTESFATEGFSPLQEIEHLHPPTPFDKGELGHPLPPLIRGNLHRRDAKFCVSTNCRGNS